MGRKKRRLETLIEWRQRLDEEDWAKVEAWRDQHRWSPNQLRHAKGAEVHKR